MNERTTSRPRRTAPWGALAAFFGAVLLGGLLSAAPARADGNFQRGFETELGRIAAHQTVAVGAHLLLGAPLTAVHVEYRPALYAPPRAVRHVVRVERRHARHDRHHDRRHERRHHRHDRDCHGH